MERVLFVTNEIYLDHTKPEGGVKLCTDDFIHLLKCKYEVINFPLQFNRRLFFRIKSRLGIDIFEDYDLKTYKKPLLEYIRTNNIKKVFINLTNTSAIVKIIKDEYGDMVKVILCSHGNESGDLLHQTVRFRSLLPWIKKITSAWRLGKILQKELEFRIKYFDMILTVSEIEQAIENWMGAKNVFYVPRIFRPNYIAWKPVIGRVGFIADISHHPNYYGLLKLCTVIKEKYPLDKIEVRIIGKPCKNLEKLLKEYNFIKAVGYLDNEQLEKETSTWMYFLNLVFYYSCQE